MKGGPFDTNLNIDSVALTLGNPEVVYSDPHLHQTYGRGLQPLANWKRECYMF